MNNLVTKKFEGQEIVFKEIEGQHMVRIDEVAKFCGWTRMANSGNEVVRWERVNKFLQELGTPTCGHGDFIPEFVMYALIGKAKNEKATQFMLWVGQTLTELRTKGVVILDHAEDKTIDFEKKFGKYRIRKTFTESDNPRKDFEQLKELSKAENKAKRLTAKERVKLYNIAFSAIDNRLNNSIGSIKASEMLAMQELLTDIKKDTLELSNRGNGGEKSYLTKRVKELEEQVLELAPGYEEYKCLNLHGFSVNSMYEPNVNKYGMCRTSFSGKPLVRRTEIYNKWIENFKEEIKKIELDKEINYDCPINIFLFFDHKDKFDASNFHKSFFDALAKHLNTDDKHFILKNCETNDYVDSYGEGKIYFCIRQA